MMGDSSAGDGISSIVYAGKSSGSSMEDSSYSVDFTLDLGLGLSIGGRHGYRKAEHDQRDRDISSTSSVCSSSLSRANAMSGTRRSADSLEGDSNGGARSQIQIVGWPPIRILRMSNTGNRAKLPATEKNSMNEESDGDCEDIIGNLENKESGRSSLFVKVNMDGIPIGRKVNLIAHSSYEILVQTLEDMFRDSTTTVRSGRSLNLLGRYSKYVLAYEDKDGDWMLVGDVPWRMFLSSVKRLRIMRSGIDTHSSGSTMKSGKDGRFG